MYNNQPGAHPHMYNQQPGPHAQMSLAGGNRNAKGLPVGPDGREWSSGLCSCFDDCGNCCLTFWCPCISYGRNKRRLEHLTRNGTPDPDSGGCCNCDCCLQALLMHFGLHWILPMMNRGSVRTRYNIEGSCCGDCCTSFWCNCCHITQEHREIQLEEQSIGGHYKH